MVSLRSPTKERVYRPSNEVEVVCPDDAAVTEPAGLTARHELHQSGGVCTWAVGWNIYGEGDYLLTTDYVAIAGTDIPHTPWDALVRSRESLCHLTELGQGKLFQLFHSSFFSSEFTLFCCKDSANRAQWSLLRLLRCRLSYAKLSNGVSPVKDKNRYCVHYYVRKDKKEKHRSPKKLQQGGGGAGWMRTRTVAGTRFIQSNTY